MCKVYVFVIITFFLSFFQWIFVNFYYNGKCETGLRNFLFLIFQWLKRDICQCCWIQRSLEGGSGTWTSQKPKQRLQYFNWNSYLPWSNKLYKREMKTKYYLETLFVLCIKWTGMVEIKRKDFIDVVAIMPCQNLDNGLEHLRSSSEFIH